MYSNEDYLIQLLTESAVLEPRQVEEARASKHPGETALEALLRTGKVDEETLGRTVAVSSSMEFMDLTHHHVPPKAIEAVEVDIARRYKIAPVDFDYGRLRIAISDPLDFETLDSLPHVLNYDLDFICTTPSAIRALFVQCYGTAEDAAGILGGGGDMISISGTEESSATADDAPVIKMVSQMLLEAFRARASDIHVEPLERDLRLRYRIDGVLHDVDHYPRKLHAAIMSRIKIMTGSMSIDEKRIPQDGRIQVHAGDRELDLRVSTVPTNNGESVVMRILDKSSLALGLADLGFLSDDQELMENMIRLPDGIILVTGPTGSGKTTTLYACLNTINKPDRKIITVEDPVEYQLSGINQVQVKEDVGMSFAAALRSILRQAPNIIMIGEIRDLETASIAINASLTGHLVFSTLHTNDAPSAVARLADIGVKRFLIASAVRAIQAQRLVRKLCPECKQPTVLSDKEMRALRFDASQLDEATIMGPVGCDKCRGTGYRGRLSVVEIFKIDDEVRSMINEELSTPQLRRRARELGMRTLRDDGIRKVMAGMTTAMEVIKVSMGYEG